MVSMDHLKPGAGSMYKKSSKCGQARVSSLCQAVEGNHEIQFPGRILLVCIASLLFLPMTLAAQQAVSHVRVVRLSYVSGTVGVRRRRRDRMD